MVQLRRTRSRLYANEGSPRMSHKVDLLFSEAVAQVIRQLQRVGYELLQCQGLWRNVGSVGESRITLFPPADGEIVFKTCRVSLSKEVIRRAPMKVKQQGIRLIFALDEHPLFHTVDVDENLLRNAAR